MTAGLEERLQSLENAVDKLVSRRGRDPLTIGLLSLILAVVVIAGAYQVIVVNPKADSAHTALCALRADLVTRVAQTQDFLKHPENFPQFNNPKVIALTQQQVEGQQRTISVLSILSC